MVLQFKYIFSGFLICLGQEFKRTRGNIISMREHAELLTSVRNDINEYKVGSQLSSEAIFPYVL